MKVIQVESELIDPELCAFLIFKTVQEAHEFLTDWSEAGDMTASEAIASAVISEVEMTEAEYAALEPYDPIGE